ncbi:MAG: hypothetical protein ABSH19_06400 [Opitutales bacterium]|jgi:hypothetical protein
MRREVQPELLDQLPPDHPDAQHNRRDLRFFNAVMGNHRWIEAVLKRHLRMGDRLLELGAGEGDLGLRLRRKWGNRPIPYAGLELWARPAAWPGTWDWRREDILKFADYAHYNIILGNLILHQFEDAALTELGRRWREQARLLVFCEPARSALHLAQLPLARLAGINHVSRHDARVSIQGGFRGRELAQLLGVDEAPWRVRVRHTFLGAYRFVAVREGA